MSHYALIQHEFQVKNQVLSHRNQPPQSHHIKEDEEKTPTTERIFMNVVARCIRSFRNGSNGSVIARVSTLCGKVGAFFSSTTTTIFHFVV